mgnify:CR=1 FL=1
MAPVASCGHSFEAMGYKSPLSEKEKILYLTRNGLCDPLGYSQVLRYLLRLDNRFEIRIISFESRENFDSGNVESVRKELSARSVHWNPLKANRRGWLPGVCISVLKMMMLVAFSRLCGYRIFHCRSYVPAFIGLLFSLCFGSKLIFDMRGFWVDELCASGRIVPHSISYKILRFLESAVVNRADAIVVLTYVARNFLSNKYSKEVGERTYVISTCVDRTRFLVPANRDLIGESENNLVFSVVGTISSGWFDRDRLASWIDVCLSNYKDSVFKIVSLDSSLVIENFVFKYDLRRFGQRIVHSPVEPKDIPNELCTHHLSGIFYSGFGRSELGRAPTKIGELLAAGVPFVISPGIGDIDHILTNYRVGELINGEGDLLAATERALLTRNKKQFLKQCNFALENYFSLESATKCLENIYSTMQFKD